METKEKSTKSWMKDLSTSLVEHDVMQLRSRLKEIYGYIEGNMQIYSMNSAEYAGNRK